MILSYKNDPYAISYLVYPTTILANINDVYDMLSRRR